MEVVSDSILLENLSMCICPSCSLRFSIPNNWTDYVCVTDTHNWILCSPRECTTKKWSVFFDGLESII